MGDVDGDADGDVVAYRWYYGPGVGPEDTALTVLDGETGEDLYDLDVPQWDEFENNASALPLYSYEARYVGVVDETDDGIADVVYSYYGYYDEVIADGVTLEFGLVDGATGAQLWKHNVQGTVLVQAGLARLRNVAWNLSQVETVANGREWVLQTVDSDDWDPYTDFRRASTGISHVSYVNGETGESASLHLPYAGPIPGLKSFGDLDGDDALDLFALELVGDQHRLSLLNRSGTQVAWAQTVPIETYYLAEPARYTGGPGTDLQYWWYTEEGWTRTALDGVTGTRLWTLPSYGTPAWTTTPDLNGDGALDLAATVAADPVSVSYRSGTDLSVISEREYALGFSPTNAYTSEAGDINGDGAGDVVVDARVGSVQKHVYVSGSTLDLIREDSDHFARPLLADIDGDGADDLSLVQGTRRLLIRGLDGHVLHRLDLPDDVKIPYLRLADFLPEAGPEFLLVSSDPTVLRMFDATGVARWTRRYP